MKNIFYLLFITIVFFSCENQPEKKGDVIPPSSVIKNPINPVKSLKYLSALIEEDESPQLYYLRSKAYFDLHEYVKASEDIEKAMKGGSDDVDYLFLSASIKYHLEMYDAALQELKLVSNSDFDAEAINQLFIQIYLAKNEVKKAKFYLSKMNVGNINQSKDLFFHRLMSGDSLRIIDELNQSASFIEAPIFVTRFYFQNYRPNKFDVKYQFKLLQVLRKYPSDPHLMRFWARFLFSINQIDRSEKVYTQVEKLLPKNPFLALEIGEFYFRLRNYTKAMDYFSEVLPNTLAYPKALVYKSVCLIYKGDKLRGLQVLDSLKQNYPSETNLLKIFSRYTKHQMEPLSSNTDSLANTTNQN